MRSIYLLLCLAILAACATGEKFRQQPNVRDDQTRLYVYRPWAFGASLGRPDIFIDGKEYATLTNGGYAFFELTPGVHTLEFKKMGETSLGKFIFTLSGGEDHYLRYEEAASTASGHYQIASDFLRDPKNTIAEFSKRKFDRDDAILWKHVKTVIDPCFYFVKPEVALTEIKSLRQVYPK